MKGKTLLRIATAILCAGIWVMPASHLAAAQPTADQGSSPQDLSRCAISADQSAPVSLADQNDSQSRVAPEVIIVPRDQTGIEEGFIPFGLGLEAEIIGLIKQKMGKIIGP